MSLDKIDRRILRELQSDARIANVALAERVGLTPSPCLRRVKRLEEEGVIRRYVAVIDAKQELREGRFLEKLVEVLDPLETGRQKMEVVKIDNRVPSI